MLNEIIPNLFLGNSDDAINMIMNNSIHTVINCTSKDDEVSIWVNSIHVRSYPNDHEIWNRFQKDMSRIFSEIANAILHGHYVLIYDKDGQSLAPIICACYLMNMFMMDVERVLIYMRKRNTLSWDKIKHSSILDCCYHNIRWTTMKTNRADCQQNQ